MVVNSKKILSKSNNRIKQHQQFPKQPIERIAEIIGIGLKCLFGRIYSALILACFCFLMYYLPDSPCVFLCAQNPVIKLSTSLRSVSFNLFVFSLYATTIFKPILFKFPRDELSIIDQLLSTFDNTQIRKTFPFQRLQILTVLILSILFSLRKSFTKIKLTSIKSCIQKWFSNFILFVLDSLFINYIYMITKRFDGLNKILRQQKNRKMLAIVSLDNFLNHDNRGKTTFDSNRSLTTSIRIVQYIHHELCVLSSKIGDNFGIYFVTISFLSLINLLTNLYELNCQLQFNSHDLGTFNYGLYAFWSFFRLIYISYTCYYLKTKFAATAIILHDTSIKSKSLMNSIIHFSLQMAHERLSFSAFGFFEMDFSILPAIASVTATYLVIFIQLESTSFQKVLNNNIVTHNTSVTENVTMSA